MAKHYNHIIHMLLALGLLSLGACQKKAAKTVSEADNGGQQTGLGSSVNDATADDLVTFMLAALGDDSSLTNAEINLIVDASRDAYLFSESEDLTEKLAAAMVAGLTEIFTLAKPKQVEAVGGIGKGLAAFYLFKESDATVQDALSLHARLAQTLYTMLDGSLPNQTAEYGEMVGAFSNLSVPVLRSRYQNEGSVILNEVATNMTTGINASSKRNDTDKISALKGLLSALGVMAEVSGLSDLAELMIDLSDALNDKSALVSQVVGMAMEVAAILKETSGMTDAEAAIYAAAAMGSGKLDGFLSAGKITQIQKDQSIELIGAKRQSSLKIVWNSPDCSGLVGGEWVSVPGNSSMGLPNGFCVMKFEAKILGENDGGDTAAWDETTLANSRISGTPWVSLDRSQAKKACENLGGNYSLMTVAMSVTIARNIETARDPNLAEPNNYYNWSNRSKSGDNYINRGYFTGSEHNSPLSANADTDPCFGTSSPSCNDYSHAQFDKKRTHKLSNGEVIWDFSGNVWHILADHSVNDYSLNGYWFNISEDDGYACVAPGCTGPQGKPKFAFGPLGDYSEKSASPYGGLGFIHQTWAPSGLVIHGGNHVWTSNAGVFTINLNLSTLHAASDVGFRCVALIP